uniref:Uncharacterized protein n=1 Tax=Arundo donax TaxID=35708 RepID=A0A0A8ZAK1_ARUDO
MTLEQLMDITTINQQLKLDRIKVFTKDELGFFLYF